jgi:hypothetical protein
MRLLYMGKVYYSAKSWLLIFLISRQGMVGLSFLAFNLGAP